MNPAVLKRFISLTFIATLVGFTAFYFYSSVIDRPPGDYEAEKGNMMLSDGKYDEALDWFNQALRVSPDHPGGLMGRSIALIQLERYTDAVAELTYIIDLLEKRLAADPEDSFVRRALSVAYANRGNVNDREARYQRAFDDYIAALRIDADAVDGPGLIDKIVHDPRPHTVRDRARYLHEQFQKPESERIMRIPELDAKQRMYKP